MCTYPTFKPLEFSWSQNVGLSNDGHNVDLLVQPQHEVDVDWLQAQTRKIIIIIMSSISTLLFYEQH